MLRQIGQLAIFTAISAGLVVPSASADEIELLTARESGPVHSIFQKVVDLAREALSGDIEASVELGEIYEAGGSFDRNVNLARAWYEAAGPSAAKRLSGLGIAETDGIIAAPVLIQAVKSQDGPIDFVWTSAKGTDPTDYILQLAKTPQGGAVLEKAVDVSAHRVIPPKGVQYWRVVARDPTARRYARTPWQRLDAPSEKVSPELEAQVTVLFVDDAGRRWGEYLALDLDRFGISHQFKQVIFAVRDDTAVLYYFESDKAVAEKIARLLPGENITVEQFTPPPGAGVPVPGDIRVVLASR